MGKKHGVGELTFTDDSVYEGEIKNDVIEGQGV